MLQNRCKSHKNLIAGLGGQGVNVSTEQNAFDIKRFQMLHILLNRLWCFSTSVASSQRDHVVKEVGIALEKDHNSLERYVNNSETGPVFWKGNFEKAVKLATISTQHVELTEPAVMRVWRNI